MEKDIELLQNIYQNSGMGVESITKLLEVVEDNKFKEYLLTQLNEYKQIHEEVKTVIHSLGQNEKPIGNFSKVNLNLMINVKTLLDKTPSHIAQMLMNGSVMGVISGIKDLKEYKDCKQQYLKILNKLVEIEEKNYQQLKKFL